MTEQRTGGEGYVLVVGLCMFWPVTLKPVLKETPWHGKVYK